MRKILIGILIGIVLNGCSQNTDNSNQTSVNEFDDLFTEILSDSLHIYNSGYSNGNTVEEWSGEIIPENLILAYGLNPESTIALAKISFNKEMTGYFIGNKEQNSIILYIYSIEKSQMTHHFYAAKNIYMDGAYEEITNCWILDLDSNKTVDIVIWQRLTDFELPNEYSDNISNEERYSYINRGNHFEYDIWKTNLMESAKLKK
jgi:hypothetical protein